MNPGSTAPYLMCDTVVDAKAENRCYPNVDFPIPELSTIGVQYFKTDDENWIDELGVFKKANKMGEADRVVISRKAMGHEGFDSKMNEFFTEHLHDDHEVRYFEEGSGYFDFRNKDDKWIRIHAQKGDLLFLPAGIYHRFITDHNEFAIVIRVFRDNVVWDAIPRSEEADASKVHLDFLKEYGLQRPEANDAH